MTLNERLVSAGLMQAFEAAARARDRSAMIEVLVSAALSAEEAARVADRVLANPKYYGY
jgi:hypothetical protein